MADRCADREWERWQADLLKTAAAALGVDLAGEPTPGLRGRTIGCRVRSDGAEWWLRVVTEPAGWAHGPAWTGNADANQITDVPHPQVRDSTEWDDPEVGRRVRAELMTLAPGPAIASEIVLRAPVELGESWWRRLRTSLHALTAHPTDRTCLDATLLTHRLLAAFGVAVDPDTLVWATAHGDVHWANLTNPGCWLLDWEAWGRAPAGYDAAVLYAASLLEPATAARVHTTFADVLDTTTGVVAQLAAAAKLARLIEQGDHPDLAVPLHRHARHLIDSCLGRPM